MAKAGKTVIQIGMQAYGGMQTELRRMSKEDRDRYAEPGTPAHDRHLAKVREMEKRRDYRANAIKEFDKNEPLFGSFKGLTREDIDSITEIRKAWKAKREAFIKELDKTHPSIQF